MENALANGWIYFLGEMTGRNIKIGRSSGETLAARVASVNAEQMDDSRYTLLAGLRADPKDESAVKRYFASLLVSRGRKIEYFAPDPSLTEYTNWLRQWWWIAIDENTSIDELEPKDPELWMPSPSRRLAAPEPEPDRLVQPYQMLTGPLAGTAWDWLISPKSSVQDYFTPPEIVEAARAAMGDIDLDAASHPIANRELRIPDFFHINRSAFTNDWYGRVWLNPPYGNNGPWFQRAAHFLNTGRVAQLCILSPVWAFTTTQARDLMLLSTATVLLSPTPAFWGNSENRKGSNHPHAVVYFGDRVTDFLQAFAPFGIPVEMAWDKVAEYLPDTERSEAA